MVRHYYYKIEEELLFPICRDHVSLTYSAIEYFFIGENMDFSFEDITFENLDDYCDLDANDNGKFVATNSYSVAQSKFNNNFIVKGVQCSNYKVGFVMYETNENRREMYIYRFMIDKEHQKKGYGKMTLEELKKIGEESDCKLIKLSTSEENRRAIKVYEASGFIDKHEKHYGEEVFEYIIKKNDM